MSGADELISTPAPEPRNRRPSFLAYDPVPLKFGTSGLRGLVSDITDLEAYINTRGFLNYLLNVRDLAPGSCVVVGGDLRPSTGRILRAVVRAVLDAGCQAQNAGQIPTPALTFYAVEHRRPSVMVTGSHIPHDRNGIKFNKSSGEVLKSDEDDILREVAAVRKAEYAKPTAEVLFDAQGMLASRRAPAVPMVDAEPEIFYSQRYLDVFEPGGLLGTRVAVFQHSAVGRDLVSRLFRRLGAQVIEVGRSDEFVPIDTENVTPDALSGLERLVRDLGPVDALVSTDGDGDRPLLVAPDHGGRFRFIRGDLLGLITAEYLGADACAVPVTANDAVDIRLAQRGVRLVKTKVGSPYVIQAMEELASEGRYRVIVSWEANGGFLTASPITLRRGVLRPLASRDALLPLLAAFFSRNVQGEPLGALVKRFPSRFSQAGLIDHFPVEIARKIAPYFLGEAVDDLQFEAGGTVRVRTTGSERVLDSRDDRAKALEDRRRHLEKVFSRQHGFTDIVGLNGLDGLRVLFRNGDIVHVRPSGNAPQLRVYATSHSEARSQEIVTAALSEPEGFLRQLQRVLLVP
jgi:phosphomannomutase